MASQFPQARRRPTRVRRAIAERNSNIVRASVLETALELGFGQNSTVADWIFNNPLLEEPEDVCPQSDIQFKLDTGSEPEATTPTLTSGSNSTSDESSSLNSPANASSAATTTIQVHSHKPSVAEPPCIHFDEFPSDQLQLFSPFTLSPHHQGSRSRFVGKLARDPDRPRSQDDSLRHNPTLESPSLSSADTGYTSEGQYLSKGKAGKGKDKRAKFKGNKASKPKTSDTGKNGEREGEYASDGGYLSASSNKSQGKSPGKVKSRAMAFFRRRTKKSARGSDDEDEDSVPPVPAIPILPRPSSPKPLELRAAPSSPTRSGFSPLTLNLSSPPASPPKRQASKSPPPNLPRVISPQQSDYVSIAQRPATPLLPSGSTALTPTAVAATLPLPPSMPGTPLSTASFRPSSPSTQLPRSLTPKSSRQHLNIPPPAPAPTLPLPQPPPSPSILSGGLLPPLPATPTTPSRKGAPTRPIPVVPATPGSTLPLRPRRAASPFRPLPSPMTPSSISHVSESGPSNGKEINGRQRSATTGLGGAPAFLQRKIQHGLPPSPRNPPPDMPLPPSPSSNPRIRPRTPIGPHSKFHEHFSSVSSAPLSQVLSTPTTLSPSPSMATLHESSSGPSVRSSHTSSTSERSGDPAIRDPLNIPGHSRPTTSASTVSEFSYGQPFSSTFGKSFGSRLNFKSHFSDRSDVSSGVYSQTHPGNVSVTTLDDDDVDVDDSAPKSYIDEDDDVSVYPSDDKTAGRRTMYLLEHGELDENGDEIVINGSHFWGGDEVPPPLPPLPPLPSLPHLLPMPTRPGPGYF